ncbi:glycoside hydrolase [Lipomyces tetrasporus]|uniref:Mannan endo-1,6-alpha-mannosidase n=1 Tax=Lipomyces tetrasporus TaxID=54092 RepID=A0AAD7QP60_9ASCO|nr:glycoside hydrolase [Lipomyces tetrasporus]KAJ8098914.1 glycoside hydrolase [Lipomyces tetrasporus]
MRVNMARMVAFHWCFCILLCSALFHRARAIDIDVNNVDSIKNAAWVFSHGVMDYYNGNQTGGTLGKFSWPYYWWEAGAAWGSMLDYWFYTGDTTYNQILTEALLANVGPNHDFMPKSEVTTEGNDDQAFWGFTVMAAAERNFTNPSHDQPQWLELSEIVFWSMAERWDTAACNGGLRWQIFQFNNGYDYKNTISNAGLFLMAARLARYTGNATYVGWAERTWDWVEQVGFLDTDYYYFYDGASSTDNCTDIKKYQWSYNAASFLAGAAYLYNFTQSEVWGNRTQNVLEGLHIFFDDDRGGVMFEVACERVQKCNTDQQSFKAYLSRFMGLTAILAPWTYDTIYAHLVNTTVNGITQSCTGGRDGVTCGTSWLVEGWDNTWGLGQQMSALETVQNLLINQVPAPYTATTGGSSPGGNGGRRQTGYVTTGIVSTGDRAGAGILTSIVLLMMLGAAWWITM